MDRENVANHQRVVIFGGKGTAINIAEQIEDAHQRFNYPMSVEGFAIDDPSLGKEVAGLPVVCGVREAWGKYRDTDIQFIFALYRPDVMSERLALLRKLEIPISRFANFVHPSAYISPSSTLGQGNIILSHASILYRVSLGNFNIINSHVVIEHEATVQDGSFVAACSCIGARVRVGSGVFLGLNSTIREDVVIADYAIIGMATCVLRNVDEKSIVYGMPAKPKL